MSNTSFEFKQFKIEQSQSAMKVGTDGILLGSWTPLRGDERQILDIGAGTGLISLMIAQRSVNATIDAVEIEPKAAREAQLNSANSPWAERVNIIESSLQDFAKATSVKYDLIISNPPYFNGSYKSEQVEKMAARHAELLSHEDLIEGVVSLLSLGGSFSAIFPYEIGAVFIAKASVRDLYVKRIVNVYPKFGKDVKRVMIEFTFKRHALLEQLDLVIEGEHGYTRQYKELTKDFYLRF